MVSAPPKLREVRDLPGPRGLPLLGNTLQVEPARLHQIAEGWAREYGDFFRFRVAGRSFLALADPDAIAAVLRDRPDGFQRSSRLEESGKESGVGGLFSANGADWKRQRPMVMAGFDPAHIKAYYPTLLKVTERFRNRWARAAASGAAIDLQADLMRYTVDVTAGLAFGADINTVESDEEVIQQHLDKMLPALFRRLKAPFPYWRYFRLPRDREMERHRRAVQAAVDGFIADARNRLAADPGLRAHPANLIEAMVAARDAEGSGLDDADLSSNILAMLIAGEDTTANTIAWMIYLLARHPEAQAKAKEEVKAVLGEATRPAPLPTHEQLGRLAYLDACMNETMRLRPVLPVMILEAARESIVAGIRVPKGHLVLCLRRRPATDEKHFRDAALFRPGRWLEGGTASPASAKRVAMPFGAGPRLCPGRYLAMHEIKMVMAMVLADFGIGEVAVPGGGEVREEMHITMGPVGLKLTLRPG